MVAARNHQTAFVVMLGGPGLSGSEILCAQIRRVAPDFGVKKKTIAKHVELIRKATEILHDLPDERSAIAALNSLYDDYLHHTSAAERSALGKSGYATSETPAEFSAGMLLPWTKDFLLYDPRLDLSRVRCPILSLIGAQDAQVVAGPNQAAIQNALSEGGNCHYLLLKPPNLNHMLQKARSGSPAEYQEIAETMSPAVLNAISGWIMDLVLP
ncbi:MAG: hypothetical protein EHM72_03750 [Calditrichaeota bacterium]|nr:MAG: hypothetical protein EHM72_03750 [Calditrichota bacterium]